VVDAEVTVFADALRIELPVVMLALSGKLCASLSMIAVLAHSVCIILLIGMRAFGDNFAMFLLCHSCFS
jgi:hypothetical protein